MKDTTPYTVPKEPGRWRAIGLAALVHAALLAFLWIGIRWQNETPATIEAEVWSPQVREAAPTPEPVKAPEPEPKPEVKETPKPPVVEPPPVPREAKPDIALEQEKKRKAEEEKKRREEERRVAEQKEKERLEKERLAQLKREEEKRIEKEKAEKAKKAAEEKAERERKAAEEKKRKQEAAEQKMRDKVREEELRRIASGVTGTGGTGDAPKSQGGRTDGGYAQRVAAKIKSNINFVVPEGMADNPAVEYEVNLLPDGSVAGIRRIKSSGIPGFDEAVRRAIERSQPYPKDKSGSVPSSFIGIHKPKDQ